MAEEEDLDGVWGGGPRLLVTPTQVEDVRGLHVVGGLDVKDHFARGETLHLVSSRWHDRSLGDEFCR